MSEKLKLPKPGALERIKGRLDKLVHRPVDRELVDALIREGELERQREREEQTKKIAKENSPAAAEI